MLILDMQLDKFTDFGLRILMTLAAHAPARLSTSAIAEIFHLSEHHLAKVASELARGGFVISERGRNGGLVLARPAPDINVGSVVRYLQKDKPVVSCFGTDTSCLILPACGLRAPLAAAREAFFATLDGCTLADITGPKTRLMALMDTGA
ncbi:MAG: Rrf2 family transcriptional regulator [Yoonia sp.]|jgi:Rrf2 family nitric oxide-sensitive transcriptional repressor|nr:Rrf2 family transcriptional regulator [Yoonia sp.]|tara:strand:+ start:2786 stop:3235 length:450 start_codon:yes stop_codon:yes gene_type:complete